MASCTWVFLPRMLDYIPQVNIKSTLYTARPPRNELTDSVEPAGVSAVHLPKTKWRCWRVVGGKLEDVSQVVKL